MRVNFWIALILCIFALVVFTLIQRGFRGWGTEPAENAAPGTRYGRNPKTAPPRSARSAAAPSPVAAAPASAGAGSSATGSPRPSAGGSARRPPPPPRKGKRRR
jgi:hypothetical protein